MFHPSYATYVDVRATSENNQERVAALTGFSPISLVFQCSLPCQAKKGYFEENKTLEDPSGRKGHVGREGQKENELWPWKASKAMAWQSLGEVGFLPTLKPQYPQRHSGQSLQPAPG